jgi:Co/Zn/Cd efflux system component
MQESVFYIAKMDCPAEESLVRMRLAELKEIRALKFNLEKRRLTVFHLGGIQALEQALSELSLGAELLSSNEYCGDYKKEVGDQRGLLWAVLLINAGLVVIELDAGLLSGSLGLVADSLDMLADAIVYALSLVAVGAASSRKNLVAKFAGYFQIVLAVAGFSEVIRRFLNNETLPDFQTMIIVSVMALLANAACLILLRRSSGREESHIKASLIFTANDVIINLGVIAAAIAVWLFESNLPDLIIGSVVFAVVLRGAFRILKLAKPPKHE